MSQVSTPPALILASASPRRRALLKRLRVPFTIQSAEIDENPLPFESPMESVRRVAAEKARVVAATKPQAIVLAADTIVVFENRILGKPKDREEALWMLRSLGGRAHEVTTAISLINGANRKPYTGAVTTRVWMRNYSEPEIAAYIASGDPFDKAGAYAIQNQMMRPVERIDGCYFNVVGLPLCEVARGLVAVGFPRDVLPLSLPPDVRGAGGEICPHDTMDVEFAD